MLATVVVIWRPDWGGRISFKSSSGNSCWEGSVLHGCWLEASVPDLGGSLSIGLLECHHDVAASFSQSKWSKRERQKLHTLPWKSHVIPLLSSIGHTDEPWYCVGGDCEYQRWGSLRQSWLSWLPWILTAISIIDVCRILICNWNDSRSVVLNWRLPKGRWQCLETFLFVYLGEWVVVCQWHLVGRGQGCC